MNRFFIVISTLFFMLPLLMAGGGHDHSKIKPSHGGKMHEVGSHVAFVEVVHDLKNGLMSIYILSPEGKPMGISNALRLNLTYMAGGSKKRTQIVTKALNLSGGKANVFEAQGHVLKSHNIEGVIALKMNSKTYRVQLEFGESHQHGGEEHKH